MREQMAGRGKLGIEERKSICAKGWEAESGNNLTAS